MSEGTEQKCVLCLQPPEERRPWDEAWDEKCIESICKLLRLELSEYADFFRCLVYCSPCHQFIREIDFTVRTLTALKQKSLKLRTTLSQMLIPNFELFGHDDCDTESCSAARRMCSSTSNSPQKTAVHPATCSASILATNEAEDDDEEETSSESESEIMELPLRKSKATSIFDIKNEQCNNSAMTINSGNDIINFETHAQSEVRVDQAAAQLPAVANLAVMIPDTVTDLVIECSDMDFHNDGECFTRTDSSPQDIHDSDSAHRTHQLLGLVEPTQTIAAEIVEPDSEILGHRTRRCKQSTSNNAKIIEPNSGTTRPRCSRRTLTYKSDYRLVKDQDNRSEQDSNYPNENEANSASDEDEDENEDLVSVTDENNTVHISSLIQIDAGKLRQLFCSNENDVNVNRPVQKPPIVANPATMVRQIVTILDLKEEEDLGNYDDNDHESCTGSIVEESGDAGERSTEIQIVRIESVASIDAEACVIEPEEAETSAPRRSTRVLKNKPNYQVEEINDPDSDFSPDVEDSDSATDSGSDNEDQYSDSDVTEAEGQPPTSASKRIGKSKLDSYCSSILDNYSGDELSASARRPMLNKMLGEVNSKSQSGKEVSEIKSLQKGVRIRVRRKKSLIARARTRPKPKNAPLKKNKSPPYTDYQKNLEELQLRLHFTGNARSRSHSHSRVDEYICGIDGCRFSLQDAAWSDDWLDVHKLEHQISVKANSDEQKTTFECPVCKLHFPELVTFESHLDRIHQPVVGLPTHIPCPMCSRKFGKGKVIGVEFRELQDHFKRVHVPRDPEAFSRFKYPCRVRDCRTRCRTEKHLEIHHRKRHENDPKPYRCELCPKTFSAATQLLVHKANNHTGPVSVCHMCGAGFPSKPKLTTHIKRKHADAERFPCKICKWVLFYPEDCEAHEKLHKHDSYTCVVRKCYLDGFKVQPKDYGSVDDLRQHVDQVHEKFQCDLCSFSGKTTYALRRHKLKHSNAKNFLCKACPKRFRSKMDLDYHEGNTHPDPNKIYTCKRCPETFMTAYGLRRHCFWHNHGITGAAQHPRKKKTVEGSQECSVGRVPRKRKKPLENAGAPAEDNQAQTKPTQRRTAKRRKNVISESESDEDVEGEPEAEPEASTSTGIEYNHNGIVTCSEEPAVQNQELMQSTPRYLTLRTRSTGKSKVFCDL